MAAYHMGGTASHEKHGAATPGQTDNKAKYEKLDGVTPQDVA